MLGPVDYIAVGFEGNNFDGSILNELFKAVDSGAIRIVDMLFVIKDEDGNLETAEIDDQSDDLKEIFSVIGFKGDAPLLSEKDVFKIGASMNRSSSVGLLVVEHLWAKGLKRAIMDKGGILMAEGRIHDDKVSAAMEEIEHIKA